MVDARMRGGRHGGLGMIGDAETCLLQHREIICPIADRHRLGAAEARLDLNSINAATLASRPRIGSLTVPAKNSPSTTRTLARASLKPIAAAIFSVNIVKPPETSTVCAPFARIVARARGRQG